ARVRSLPHYPICTKPRSAGCMMAGSDRGLSNFPSGSTAPTLCPASIVGAVRHAAAFTDGWRLCCVIRVCERKCVMGRMNWSRLATRDRMRRHGVEDVKGKMPFVAEPPKPQPRRKLSKGELRQQTAAAFLAWRAGQTSKKDK